MLKEAQTVSDLLKLELQTVVNHLKWILRTKLEVSVKTSTFLNPQSHLSGSKRKERMSSYGLLFMALAGTVWDSMYMED